MAALSVGILGLDGILIMNREQGIEAVDDFLGGFGLIHARIEGSLLGLLDRRGRLDLSGIEVRDVRLIATEDGHRSLHVGLTALVIPHAPLGLTTSHIAGLKVGVLLQYRGKVIDSLAELPGAHVQQGSVI